MQFYNGLIAPLIIQPLRYFFSKYSAGTNLIWDEDEKKRTIDIGEAYDFNKIALQEKPRIVVTRGAYMINKTGLTDNLAEAVSFESSRGNKDYKNMVMYVGSASILIEARNKGTCELLADMTSHFIVWTRPVLCDSQGWKEFGLPMQVSDVGFTQDEDPGVPKFQINISIPWLKEEHWSFKTDGVNLKKILMSVTPSNS
jgi:hypothetical protein